MQVDRTFIYARCLVDRLLFRTNIGYLRQVMPNKLEPSSLFDFDETDSAIAKRIATIPYRKAFISSLVERKPYLVRNEDYYLKNVLPGSGLDPNRISPAIRFCETRNDHDLFDFLSTLSSFPGSSRLGRRFRFFIIDEGHDGAPVMALGCLASAIRLLRARDEWIGWHGSKWKMICAQNLAFVMDLSTCVGIPPYSWLTSGKLLCYACLSRELRQAYSMRYASQYTMKLGRIVTDIALIVVLGAFSSNTPQYKGISIDGRNHFKFVGYTRGYSSFQISGNTYEELLSKIDVPQLSKKRCLNGGGNPKLRMLRLIARRMNLDEEHLANSGHRRAVFVAPLAHNSRTFLRGEDDFLVYFNYPLEDLVKAWKQKWLWRRWASDEVVRKVRNFTTSQLSLKHELAYSD